MTTSKYPSAEWEPQTATGDAITALWKAEIKALIRRLEDWQAKLDGILRQAIGDLPPQDRELLTLYYCQRLNQTAIARQLGLKDQPSVSRKHTAILLGLQIPIVRWVVAFLPSETSGSSAVDGIVDDLTGWLQAAQRRGNQIPDLMKDELLIWMNERFCQEAGSSTEDTGEQS